MSELSDGQEADRKGTAQARHGDAGSEKRRRRRKGRSSAKRSERQSGSGPHIDGDSQRDESVVSAAVPTPEDPHQSSPGRRRKRRCARPGKKRPGSPHTVTRAPDKPAQTASAEQSAPQKDRRDSGRNRNARNRDRDGKHRSGVYAALDLGTNNCRLLMAVPRQRGKFRVIDGYSRIVRLGEGLSRTGKLSDDAMDRAVDALGQCAAKLKARDVRKSRLIATEACRQAENGDAFLTRVKEETGLELEVVSRETEARLAAEGCGSLMDRDCDAAVMFDIGGGSTELILVHGHRVRRGRIRDRIEAWTSLPMGVVTLAERFGGKDVTEETFDEMIGYVRDEILKFSNAIQFAADLDRSQIHLLGTSGTVTTMAGIHLGLERYQRRLVDGLWMQSDEVDTVKQQLLGMDYEARKDNPCIGVERADLVLSGCAILEAIRSIWPADRLRVADRGLREGLLTQMMQADRVWRSPWNRRRSSRNGRGRQ